MVRIINIDTKTRTIRVSNGKDDLEWFTTDTGSHVPLKKGQSKAEAIKEHFGDKKQKPQLERLEKMGKAWGKDQMSVLRELGKTNPQGLKDELDRIDAERERTTKAHKEWLKEKASKQPAKQDKVSGKAIAAAKKEMLARQAKERKALRDSSSRLGESYYKQRVNELIKQQEIEEQDFYEGHGIKAPKAKQQPAKQKSKPTSYQLEDAFEEADLGEEWKSAQRRMDFHGVSQYTIKDIIDSGMYEAGDIIEALESNRHDKIDEMKKMADRIVGEKKRETQWEEQFGPLDEKKYQEWKKNSKK